MADHQDESCPAPDPESPQTQSTTNSGWELFWHIGSTIIAAVVNPNLSEWIKKIIPVAPTNQHFAEIKEKLDQILKHFPDEPSVKELDQHATIELLQTRLHEEQGRSQNFEMTLREGQAEAKRLSAEFDVAQATIRDLGGQLSDENDTVSLLVAQLREEKATVFNLMAGLAKSEDENQEARETRHRVRDIIAATLRTV